MPSLIVKPEKDVDFYVVWSSVVDNITAAGTRAQLQHDTLLAARKEAGDDRFDRADQYGSSAHPEGEMAGDGYWDAKGFVVSNEFRRTDCTFFWLDRGDLAAFARGDTSVLKPLEDMECDNPLCSCHKEEEEQ